MPCLAHAGLSTHDGNAAALRLAVLDLKQPSIEQALAAGLAKDDRVRLSSADQTAAAARGFGYDGSINMTISDARRLGAAIGCDFFIVGKSESVTRSEKRGESHEQAYVGLLFVDGRSGKLALFEFITRPGDSKETAFAAVAAQLTSECSRYVEKLQSYRAAALASKPSSGADSDSPEEIPPEGSSRLEGFAPPAFTSRARPEYPAEAEQANITATVEARVVFGRNGEVGEIEITRWAGFGLEKAAERAIRQLKFKPATRDGRPVSVMGTVQYNFRRLNETSPPPDAPARPAKPAGPGGAASRSATSASAGRA